MNFNRILSALLFIIILSAPYTQAQVFLVNPYSSDEQDKVNSLKRVEDVGTLLKDLKSRQPSQQHKIANALSVDVVLLESTLYVTQDYSRDIKIMGELKNTGSQDTSFVKINYTFKDASDEIVDSSMTYVFGYSKQVINVISDTVLPPGEVGSFELYTDVPYDSVNSMYYTVSYETYETYPLKSEITLNGNLVEQQDSFGDLKLLGEVINISETTAYFVKIVGTIKDGENQVIDVGFSYIDGKMVDLESGITTDTGLYPGDRASFIIYTDAGYSETETITYKINRQEGGVVSIPIFSITPILPLLFE